MDAVAMYNRPGPGVADDTGYIDPDRLRELWFHIGTACNLACPFCLEGSKPGDNRLQQVTLAEAVPFVDEALTLGVEQFSFTGGEPFVVRDFPKILDYALQHRPCLTLTNATEPLLRRIEQVKPLRERPHAAAFRVSLDAPDRATHDQGRGEGSFDQALEGMRQLHELGFDVSAARQMAPDENGGQVNAAFRQLFADRGLPEDMTIVAFPDFHTPGAEVDVPHITRDCMTRHQSAGSRSEFMCAFSRMVVKQAGRMRVYACTLVDDDPDYDLGNTLTDSLQRVYLHHHRCYSCFSYGSSCSELKKQETAENVVR